MVPREDSNLPLEWFIQAENSSYIGACAPKYAPELEAFE
jgi:hypothetical protein